MIPHFCSKGHLWRNDEPGLMGPIWTCPEHDGLPFHNGPDDRFAQEED